jgi:hypothetical protein
MSPREFSQLFAKVLQDIGLGKDTPTLQMRTELFAQLPPTLHLQVALKGFPNDIAFRDTTLSAFRFELLFQKVWDSKGQ